MDRNKSVRNIKGKITHHPSNLFALGSKPTTSRDDDKRTSLPSTSKLTTLTSTDRKREAPSGPAQLAVPHKKSKLFPTPLFTANIVQPIPTVVETWENYAIDCDESDLNISKNVLNALHDNDLERAIGYFLGCIKLLKSQQQRFKPEPIVGYSLVYIAKMNQQIIQNTHVTQALCSLLRKDNNTSTFKSKSNPCLPTLAANLLMNGYEHLQNWPEFFLKIYMEDALGDRIWVDHELSQSFIDNIVSQFNTKIPPKTLLQSDLVPPALPGGNGSNRESTGSPQTVLMDDDSLKDSSSRQKLKNSVDIYPRFSHLSDNLEMQILDYIKEQMNKKQASEQFNKNLIKFLTAASGFVEIRNLAVTRLEMWIHNAKLMRFAQDLLVYVCYNTVTVTQRDVEVITQLIKIRFKSKVLVNMFLSCLREMILIHPENLQVILKHTIYNELSPNRNPNNMAMLFSIFQTTPIQAINQLADIFFELLLNKDDYLRPLRALLREIVRVLRHDFDTAALCQALLRPRNEIFNTIVEFEFKERLFASIVDLICLCMFLTISPTVREAATSRGEKKEKDTQVLQKFQKTISQIVTDAIVWLKDGLKAVMPFPLDYSGYLKKIVILEPIDAYCKQDLWPAENDRILFFRLVSEVPLTYRTISTILWLGLSKDSSFVPLDALEICESLIKRVALVSGSVSMPTPSIMLDINEDTVRFKHDIVDLFLRITMYRPPEKIFPIGYVPPNLTVTMSYWRSWIILLILSAHNPSTLGNYCWDTYPTMRMLMEMCITNHFVYPPPTMLMGDNYEDLKAKETIFTIAEKQQILEYESHLATNAITEQNSFLLPQVIIFDPKGIPRRPSQQILDQLNTLNKTHHLGQLFCRSRRPDFLLNIIQRQGPTSQNMPWLADLVQNCEGALDHLPVQCLCEFLLSSGLNNFDSNKDKVSKQKHKELVLLLNSLVTNPGYDSSAASEVLEYFLRKLASPHYISRWQAIKGVKLILESANDEEQMEVDDDTDSWLNIKLPSIPHFLAIRYQITSTLRQACQVENDAHLVSSYITFLAEHPPETFGESLELVVDMAQLIVERSIIISAVLPSGDELEEEIAEEMNAYKTLNSLMIIFSSYLEQAKLVNRDAYEWTESNEQLFIQWANGDECIIHVLVLHAMITLLTYGPSFSNKSIFDQMINTWFPLDEEQPKAFVLESRDQVLFIPDWLKLRMIRSHVDRLVDFALKGLEPHQLVLFIQSFGIPIKSMTKLLNALDVAVRIDRQAVEEAVIDKVYMAQLVEVQKTRGATGGSIFVHSLNLIEPEVIDNFVNKVSLTQKIEYNVDLLNEPKPSKLRNIKSLLDNLCGNLEFDMESYKKLKSDLVSEIKNDQNALSLYLVNYLLNQCDSVQFLQLTSSKNNIYLINIIKLILTKNDADCRNIIELIYDKLKTVADNKLKFLFENYFAQVGKNNLAVKKEEMAKTSVESMLKVDNFINALQKVKIFEFEKFGRRLIENGLKFKNNILVLEALTKLLDKVSNNKSLTTDHCGIFVDWISLVEPELIGSCLESQINLMFSKTKKENKFRAFLLTLLIHRASWATLHQCVGHLLSESIHNYDSNTVLDFLWALTQNPKMWQGSDKCSSNRNFKNVDILELSHPQLKSLINYILDEAINNEDLNSIHLMEKRLPLLLFSIENAPESIVFTIRYLIRLLEIKKPKKDSKKMEIVIDGDNDKIGSNLSEKQKVVQQFVLLLYMYIPKIIFYLNKSTKKIIFDNNCYLNQSSFSELDKISHCVFTALCSTNAVNSKEWTTRSEEYEILARKMTESHSRLLLRQLPMISTLLQGRPYYEFHVLKSRGHLKIFNQIMGIIELLEPNIFEKHYQKYLENLLKDYLNLFKKHGHLKEVTSLLIKFVNILHDYIKYDSKKALKYIQKHAHLLKYLQTIHTNIPTLRDLVVGISIPHFDPDIYQEQQENDDALVAVIPTQNKIDDLPTSWNQFKANLSNLQDDDIFDALQQIDFITSKRPNLLSDVLMQLCCLNGTPLEKIRNLAYDLIIRYLKYNLVKDSTSAAILSSILRCMNSINPCIVLSTLERLPEITALMQEYAIPILEETFLLGIGSDVNTTPYIIQVIERLNLQNGC